MSPLPMSSTLATNPWPHQTRRRALGARIGAPEGPVRGSGAALHPFTLRTTPERGGIEVPWTPVAGDTRFRSTRFELRPGQRLAWTEHSARASDRILSFSLLLVKVELECPRAL